MTGERRKHPFRKQSDRWRGSTVQGVDWDATMSLLDHELWQLDAESVVLQMAVERLTLQGSWGRCDMNRRGASE